MNLSVLLHLFMIFSSGHTFSSQSQHKNIWSRIYLLKDNPSQNEVQYASAAEAISLAETLDDLLEATKLLIVPGRETYHYHYQEHHQKKRQAGAVNALKRLVKFLIGESEVQNTKRIVSSSTFEDILLCALSPILADAAGGESSAVNSKEVISRYFDAWRCLGSLGPFPANLNEMVIAPFVGRLEQMIKTESNIKDSYISGAEWACRRIGLEETTYKKISEAYKSLDLPFHVDCGFLKNKIGIEDIRKEVPFQIQELITKNGKRVQERRETCWMAEPGIGGLAYSGKIMSPVPFSPSITRARDAIEEAWGIRYDCCLINWYGDGESACKFHSDPDMGRLWARDTVVVSIGETRRFNLRRIQSTSDTTTTKQNGNNKSGDKGDGDEESSQHSFHVFDGDCFHMFGDCQEEYQHCVMTSEGPTNNRPRASIVFKKSLPGPGGRRGHGLGSKSVTTGPSGTVASRVPLVRSKVQTPLNDSKHVPVVSSNQNKTKKSPKPKY